MNTSQRIDRLEGLIRELRIEHEKFLNGAVEVPPEQLRAAIHRELRSLRNANLKGVEHNFRLSNLEAKYNSYSELFGRRVREQEEGRGMMGQRDAGPRHDPSRGVVVGDGVGQDAVEALYQGLQSSGGSRPKFDLDSFRSYLDRQLHAIRQKTGCDRVVFRVAEDQGKMKLKARPVRETPEG
jgi:hypothetical protein